MVRILQDGRPLLSSLSKFSNAGAVAELLLLVGVVAAVASVAIALCTTHKHSKSKMSKKVRANSSPTLAAREERRLLSTSSSKAVVADKEMTTMLRRPEGGSGVLNIEAEEEAAVLWRKSIIMGERCRPLQFSGQILYDSEGNQVPNLNPFMPRRSGGGSQVENA